MALRFQNERVISRLRGAYSSTFRDDSLLLNDDFAPSMTPLTDEQFDEYLATLTLKQQQDVANDTRLKAPLITSRSESLNIAGVSRKSRKSDADESLLRLNFDTVSSNEIRRDSSAYHLNSSQLLELNEEHHSFDDVKGFGLEMDGESDFEDDMLRATQEIKHNKGKYDPMDRGAGHGEPISDSRSAQQSSGPRTSRQASLFNEPEAFAKRTELITTQSDTKSRLTNQLTATQRDPREQYLEATTGLKLGQSQRLDLLIRLQDRPPFKITVKDTCSAHLAIGFALLSANAEIGDANMYNLRLVEDDGELDEDFPALDRTRPIGSYHVEEFALVKATESEFRENSKRTPNKVTFKSKTSASKVASSKANVPSSVPPQSGNNLDESSHRTQPDSILAPPSQLVRNAAPDVPGVRITNVSSTGPVIVPTVTAHPASTGNQQPPPTASGSGNVKPHLELTVPERSGSHTSTSYATSFGDGRNDFVVVKVYMHPYDPILSRPFWTDEMVSKQTKLSEVFEQMCREKMMDSDMYVLRSAEKLQGPKESGRVRPQSMGLLTQSQKAAQPQSLEMDLTVQSLVARQPAKSLTSLSVGLGVSSGVNNNSSQDDIPCVILDLIPKRQLQGSQGKRSGKQSLANHASSINSQSGKVGSVKNTPNNELQNAVLAMQPLGFHKYPVIRRQQMNFLGRSGRDLVIDGEYIHIMPPTDWSLLDQPKTTTFHIKQVLRVKQSRKVNTNISIVIMKSSGPKRYDLECQDSGTAAEIVDQLQRLQKWYAKLLS